VYPSDTLNLTQWDSSSFSFFSFSYFLFSSHGRIQKFASERSTKSITMVDTSTMYHGFGWPSNLLPPIKLLYATHESFSNSFTLFCSSFLSFSYLYLFSSFFLFFLFFR
jgi:hypothetical protein